MIRDITIGQYYPGKSLLHRIDPRMKLILTFAVIVTIFLCRNFFSLGVIAVTAVAAAMLSGVPAKMLLKSLKPIVIILIFFWFALAMVWFTLNLLWIISRLLLIKNTNLFVTS